jgi:hypothetical protein
MQSRAISVVRARWLLGLAAVVAATLSVSLLQSTGGAATAPAASAPATAEVAAGAELGFAVQLGPEQRVTGPTDQGDNPYFSERRGGKLRGFFGTSRTIEWLSHNNTRLTNSRIILDRGGAGKFDQCGAWMQGSVQKLTSSHWIAFYHAEGKGPGEDTCDHYGDTTVWRMAMAETTNGGKTWKRPNYPNNVVVTGAGATRRTGVTNAGTGRVVKVGTYYYMFFKTAHGPKPGPSGIQVARSAVSDGGRPGTWKKYYCHPATLLVPAYCAFDEQGIGGRSTPVGGISEKARYIAWNTALDRWLGFDASGKRGFRLYASEVGAGATAEDRQQDALFDGDGLPKRWMSWTDTYPLVSTATDKYVDQWGGDTRNRRSKQLYAYPSIGGADGDSMVTGSTFYVYYVKLFPGDKFTHRYLFRRKVTVVPNSTALNRVELTTYRNGTGQRRSSTEAPKEKAFRRTGPTGYLLAHGADGWRQVFDCVRRDDHALFVTKCRTGWSPVRRVGFIHPEQTADASVPVYRCVAKRSHYASTSPDCGGGKRETRLGFALGSL